MNYFFDRYGSKVMDNKICEVRACRICLQTDIKLFNLSEKHLRVVLAEFTGISTHVDGVPLLVCGICLHYLDKFRNFKSKCNIASKHFHKLQAGKQLTTENIKSLDRNDLCPMLKITAPEVHSYSPTKRELHTSTFHIDLANDCTKDELSNDVQFNQNSADVLVNYVDCTTHHDLEIKKEYPDHHKFNYNIKIVNINYEDLNHCNDNNDNDYSHNDDACGIDDFISYETLDTEIKQESVEETNSTNAKKVSKKRKLQTTEINTKIKKPKLLAEIKNKEVGCKNKIKDVKRRRVRNKKNVGQSELTAKDEVDKEMDQDRKNALLFYNSHPSKKISKTEINRRMEMLEKFSTAYNVEVKFLSREEQIIELQHRQRYYKNLPFTCDLCYRGYSIQDAYQAHMAVHDPSSGDYECDVCKIRCKSNRDREKHINATHLKRFKCKQCGVVTKSQSYAKAHFARHAGASYACDQCGKRYTQQTNYLSHMRNVHGDRARHCPLCYDTFLGQLGLRVHMGIVHKQAVECSSCGAQFDCGRALDKHLEHSVDKVCEAGVKPCPQCGVNFSTEKILKKHYDTTHRLELKCEQCGKSFPSKMKLSTHMNEHHKCSELALAGGIICETCGKGNFKNLNQLRSHQRVHTGERPYSCGLCTKTFRISSLLKSHMRVHTDERRYKCALCPKAFHQSAHRTAHLLTHTRERPHPCAACPKRYTSASAAREHADTVHRGLPSRRRDKHKDN